MIKMFHKFIKKILPAIRIHSWGGFGSQLFALIIAGRLSKKAKYRRIRIIFHTSGVTERNLEIPQNWLERYEIEKIADFSNALSSNGIKRSTCLFKVFRQILRKFTQLLGIINSSNAEEDFRKIRPWILAIRGHYTQIHLTYAEIHTLMKHFELDNDKSVTRANAIHYRLGDLLILNEKSIIDPDRVLQIWKKHCKAELPLRIFSDGNSSQFEKVWKSVEGPPRFEFQMLSPIETIQSCYRAEEFIGTNAKLSLWIAIFRIATTSRPTYIPIEINHQLITLLGLQGLENSIHVY